MEIFKDILEVSKMFFCALMLLVGQQEWYLACKTPAAAYIQRFPLATQLRMTSEK